MKRLWTLVCADILYLSVCQYQDRWTNAWGRRGMHHGWDEHAQCVEGQDHPDVSSVSLSLLQLLIRTEGGGAEFSSCAGCGVAPCKKVHNYYQWVAYILVLQVTLEPVHDLVAFVGGAFPSAPPAVVNHGRGASERHGQRNQWNQVGNVLAPRMHHSRTRTRQFSWAPPRSWGWTYIAFHSHEIFYLL